MNKNMIFHIEKTYNSFILFEHKELIYWTASRKKMYFEFCWKMLFSMMCEYYPYWLYLPNKINKTAG